MARLGKAALAIAAAVKATGAHRYRIKEYTILGHRLVEVCRSDEHGIFTRVGYNWVKLRSVTSVGGVRVVPSK